MITATNSWCTSSVPAERAFSAWSERLEAFFPEYSYQGRDRGAFQAAYRQRMIGALSLVAFRFAHADGLCRPWRLSADRRFELKYVLDGSTWFESAGGEHMLHAGDMILLDHRTRFRFSAHDPVRCVCLSLPETWLAGRLPDPEAGCFTVMRRHVPWVTTLGSLVTELAGLPEGDQSASGKIVAEQIGGLLQLVFGGTGSSRDSLHRRRLERDIVRNIALRYQDVTLSVTNFARAYGISKRYLHSLLASAGTTFGKELTRARLAHARALLEDPLFSRVTIGDIAYRCGFSDPMHFSRRFRDAYGLSPSDFRAGASRASS